MTQQITELPPAPDSNDPTNFNAKANAFVAALPQFRTEANALAVEANTHTNTASAAATTATTKAAAASASETNALSYKNSAEVSSNASANSASASAASANAAAASATAAALWDPSSYNVKTISNPIGMMVGYHKASAPSGWILCNGSALSRTTYAALFAEIGTTFGTGDGTTTFNVPDFRDRFPIGAGTTYATGEKGGSKDSIVVSHTHSASSSSSFSGNALPNHSHEIATVVQLIDGQHGPQYQEGVPMDQHNTTGVSAGTPSGSVSTSTSISSAGVSGTNANLPPYISMYWLIKY